MDDVDKLDVELVVGGGGALAARRRCSSRCRAIQAALPETKASMRALDIRRGARTTTRQSLVISSDIVRRAELYRGDMAVSVVPQEGVDRVAAAQAAEEFGAKRRALYNELLRREAE